MVCFSRLANALWFLGHDDAARGTCDDALALADQVGHALSQATATIFSCLLAIDMDDRDQLRVRLRKLDALGLDTLPFATKREAIAGMVDVLDDRASEGISRTRAALARCEGRNFNPGLQAAIARILVAAHATAGDATGGLEACERALGLASTPIWDAEIHRARALFLYSAGAEPAQAHEALQVAEDLARHQRAEGHRRRIEDTRRRLGLAASPAPLA